MVIGHNDKTSIRLKAALNFTKDLLTQKSILTSKYNAYLVSDILFLELDLYYKSSRIKRYNRHKRKVSTTVFSNIELNKFSNMYHFFKFNAMHIKIHNLNCEIDVQAILDLNGSMLPFKRLIYNKRENLYYDFLSCTCLLIKEKISIDAYLVVLCETFNYLHKKKQKYFFQMIEFLIDTILKSNIRIKGIKLNVSGRINGAQRANTSQIKIGSTPTNDYKNILSFTKKSSFTFYGIYGFKLWISYDYESKKI